MRVKFPQHVHAAVVSGAPLNYFEGLKDKPSENAFFAEIAKDFTLAGSEQCERNLHKSLLILQSYDGSEQKLKE